MVKGALGGFRVQIADHRHIETVDHLGLGYQGRGVMARPNYANPDRVIVACKELVVNHRCLIQ